MKFSHSSNSFKVLTVFSLGQYQINCSYVCIQETKIPLKVYNFSWENTTQKLLLLIEKQHHIFLSTFAVGNFKLFAFFPCDSFSTQETGVYNIIYFRHVSVNHCNTLYGKWRKKKAALSSWTDKLFQDFTSKAKAPCFRRAALTWRHTQNNAFYKDFIEIFVFRHCSVYWEIFIELYLLAVKYTECVERKACLGGRLLGMKGIILTCHFWRRQVFFFLTVLKACCHRCCTGSRVLSWIRCFKQSLP